MNTVFTDPTEARAYGLAREAEGWTVRVRVIPAAPAEYAERVSIEAILGEVQAGEARGETLGRQALDWASRTYWWRLNAATSVAHALGCLENDALDGASNGARSAAQARLFVQRLMAAASRAPKTSVLVRAETPMRWELQCTPPARPVTSGDSAAEWGHDESHVGWGMGDD